MKLPLLLAAALGIGGYTLTRSLVKRPPPLPPPTLPAPPSPDKIPPKETTPASSTFKPGNNNTAARPKAPRPTLDQLLQAEPEKRLDLVIPWLPEATAEEVETLTNAWDDSLDSTEGLWDALVRRWVEVDPTAALAHARVRSLKTLAKFGNPSVTRFTVLVRSVPAYRAFLQLKPADALALLSTEPVPLLAQLLQQLSYSVEQKHREEWAAANAHLPDSKLWAATPPPPASSKPYRGLLVISEAGEAIKMKLAKQDLSGGLADIEALPRNHERSILELHYAEALAQKSPTDALAWAKSKLGGLSQMQAIALVAKELSKTDPAKALAMLMENNVRAIGETRLGAAMVSTDQGSTISYQGNWEDVLKTTLSAAARQDPHGAMDFLVKAGGVLPRDMSMRFVDNDDKTNNGSLARSLYKEWVAKDPKSAATWLASQSPTLGMDELTPLVSSALTAQKGSEGRQFITSLPDSPLRQKLVAGAAAEWALDDAPTALGWAASNGGEPGLTEAFRNFSTRDAVAASQQFNLLPPEIQSAQLQDLTNALGEQKPLSLPEFYAQLPGDQWAAMDLRQAITAFAKQNSHEASIWVNQLPNNEARDTAVSGLVDYLLGGSMPDLEAAAHWAASSVDPEAQTRRLQRVAKAWNKNNPSGAANAINNSQLSEPVRQQLLQYLTPANP